MRRHKSRYYELASPIVGPERQRWLNYWGAYAGSGTHYLEAMTLCGAGLGFMSEARRGVCLERFNAAVGQFGPAYEGGSLVWLTRAIKTKANDFAFVDSSQSWFPAVRHYHLSDHSTFFQRPGEPVSAIIWQPYDYDDANDGEPLRQFCAANGLSVEVSEEKSWHLPGATTALIFTRSEQPTYQGHWLN